MLKNLAADFTDYADFIDNPCNPRNPRLVLLKVCVQAEGRMA
jgi:hypothetical protein